ncbi:threonine aldolase family protein [Polyangium aurulentum]|uniref:threonine aldolase family protein n=1 Tax=Polyangium aurulentum TaxID=2567896 RepID=UPI0010AE33F3|nr:beta-eliminating lyase-related protein [Polyangium aurulentum]UQA61944.1 beta-1,3-galactosyltransferase [Polyangium aurulentum]
MLSPEAARIKASCTRFLSHHHPSSTAPRQVFQDLLAMTPPELARDEYGGGEVIADFEREIAELLGKEAAVFMPSGTMAQQIAVRIWADRRASRHIGFHPTSHLELHEQHGYQLLHGLHGVLLGKRTELMTPQQVRDFPHRLGALLLELPQREIGGLLPSWEELIELRNWATETGTPLHLDGARLWETKPFYGRDYATIAGLFDSVYVSFYKILGGIAGCVLAGPKDFIAEARLWQRRHGGTLVSLYPYVLAAKAGMAARLDRMELYRAKALELALALDGTAGISVQPRQPHVNMMHVFLPGNRAALEKAALDVARASGVWLFGALAPTDAPRVARLEVTVGDAGLELTGEEVAALLRDVVERAARV